MKKKLLIICYSNLNSDPRILRQFEALNEEYEIYTAGYSPILKLPKERHYTIGDFLNYPNKKGIKWLDYLVKLYRSVMYKYACCKFKKYKLYYWDIDKIADLIKLKSNKFDIVIANDIQALPLALKISKNSKVYFDAHEYAPLEYEDNEVWLKYSAPYQKFLCEQYIKKTHYRSTVSSNLAKRYQELTGLKFDLIYNAPGFKNLPVQPTKQELIRFIHHGLASPIRKIESMIEAFKKLGPKYELNLLLMKSDLPYYKELVKSSKGYSNIVFHEPINTEGISAFICQFDVSLIFIPPVNFNYKYCLPNKFFESVQARLMLICGPSPEMAELVEQHKLGYIAAGFSTEDIYGALLNLEADKVDLFKHNSDKAAKFLSSEISQDLLKRNVKLLSM